MRKKGHIRHLFIKLLIPNLLNALLFPRSKLLGTFENPRRQNLLALSGLDAFKQSLLLSYFFFSPLGFLLLLFQPLSFNVSLFRIIQAKQLRTRFGVELGGDLLILFVDFEFLSALVNFFTYDNLLCPIDLPCNLLA